VIRGSTRRARTTVRRTVTELQATLRGPATSQLQDPHCTASVRAEQRKRVMEIAAFLMVAAAVMGLVQQFDRASW
jgi:hypothetical protein